MADFPIPSFAEIRPMLPGAAVGVVCALAASALKPVALRALLGTGAVVAPWWMTWAATHGDSIPAWDQGSAERAGLAVVGLSLATLLSPEIGKRFALGLPLRFVVLAAAVAAALWTFLDPEHPYHVGTLEVLSYAGVGILVTAPMTLAAKRLTVFATGSIVSASVGALGLLLFALSSAAALSQVAASLSITAGLTAAAAKLVRSPGLPANLPAAWLAAGFLATATADHNADEPLPMAVNALLVAAVLVALLPALRSSERAKSTRSTITAVALSGLLSIAALVVADQLSPEPTESEVDDPYAGFESYK